VNYIHQLEAECRQRQLAAQALSERIHQLRQHLALPKFNPVQADGSRGDWISTADVQRWLRFIEEGAHT
jgi:hypothetical protein